MFVLVKMIIQCQIGCLFLLQFHSLSREGVILYFYLRNNLNSNFTKLAMTETKILTTSQTKDTQAFWFWYCFKPETDFTGLGHRTTG
jgi:hypothetical protein